MLNKCSTVLKEAAELVKVNYSANGSMTLTMRVTLIKSASHRFHFLVEKPDMRKDCFPAGEVTDGKYETRAYFHRTQKKLHLKPILNND